MVREILAEENAVDIVWVEKVGMRCDYGSLVTRQRYHNAG